MYLQAFTKFAWINLTSDIADSSVGWQRLQPSNISIPRQICTDWSTRRRSGCLVMWCQHQTIITVTSATISPSPKVEFLLWACVPSYTHIGGCLKILGFTKPGVPLDKISRTARNSTYQADITTPTDRLYIRPQLSTT
jgi:hypothetical protein